MKCILIARQLLGCYDDKFDGDLAWMCSFGWVSHRSVSPHVHSTAAAAAAAAAGGVPQLAVIDRRVDGAMTWGPSAPDDRNQPIASGVENDGHWPRWKMNLSQALGTDGRTVGARLACRDHMLRRFSILPVPPFPSFLHIATFIARRHTNSFERLLTARRQQ